MAEILLKLSSTGVIKKNRTEPEKRRISTQVDRYIPEKFIVNHPKFARFVQAFFEYIEEHNIFSDVEWSSSTTYNIDDICCYEGIYYKANTININNNPIAYSQYWDECEYNTLGIYEHIINAINYLDPDFITENYNETDRYQLFSTVANKMADNFIQNKKIYKDSSGHPYSDLVKMSKLINTEKLTAKSFERAINYIDNINSLAYVAFGETKADIEADFLWGISKTYAEDDRVIYNKNVYCSIVDSNIGYNPESNPLKWELLGEHMIYNDNLDVPMEYGDRFRYYINSNDFRINRLISIIHPAGYLLELVYFPLVAKEEIIVSSVSVVSAIGSGIVSGSFTLIET